MKWLAVGLGVVAIALMLVYIKVRQNPTAERETGQSQQASDARKPAPSSTDEVVQSLAQEAVKDAAQNSHISLDYSPSSIQDVEKVLGNLSDQYAKTPSSVSVKGLSAAYGAYIGEVIRRSEPNIRWERDDPQFGEKVYPLHWGEKVTVYPMAWCEKRIVDGDGDNVWMKYKTFKSDKL